MREASKHADYKFWSTFFLSFVCNCEVVLVEILLVSKITISSYH